MIKKKIRLASFFLAIIMLLSSGPIVPSYAEETLSLDVSCPFGNGVYFTLPDNSTTNSNSYRIPAMVTLNDGTIVAASDIRWNTTYDGGGLDTLVARSSDGGVSWEYTLANYLGDNGNEYNGSSTCYIDPCLTVAPDGQTVYMLVDLYPYGVALNGSKEVTPSYEVGFNENGYLKLSNNNHSTYSFYLKDGLIYNSSNTPVSGYTVDDHFNIYYNGTLSGNLFYSDSPYKVVRTGYLYLISSPDGGKSWSAPMLLNLKTSSENVCLVGPGRGITTADGTMIFPVYSYGGSTESQRMGFVYSKDGANWERVQSSISWSSESAVVEIGSGTLRFFYRNGTGALCYVDYNMTQNSWGTYVNTGLNTNSNTQLSAITYSKKSDGKQVVLVSCPTGPYALGSSNNNGGYRLNGRIFTGIVEANGTMTWNEAINVNGVEPTPADSSSPYTEAEGFFAYSCLTERPDGSVAILYENRENAWGTGSNCYYAMNMKAYAADDLGINFDSDDSGGDTEIPDQPTSEITANGVTVSSNEVVFTELNVTASDVPSESYIKNAVAYSVSPEVEGGIYNGPADITVNIPSGWDTSKTFAYVKNTDGTITVLSGEVLANGRFVFPAPFVTELGIFEATESSAVTNVTVILKLGESSSEITVSDTENEGTAGTYTTAGGEINYTVGHGSSESSYELDTNGIDSESKYLITLNGYYAVTTSSGNNNAWHTEALPINTVNLNGTADLSEMLWTVTETSGGYYIQNPDGEYMTIQTGNSQSKNYTVTLSQTPSICDISTSGNGYMIFADGKYIGLNNAGGANTTALGWYSVSNTVWHLYKYISRSGTSVSFKGLDVTSGTDVTVGGTTYTVIVKPKAAAADAFVRTGSSVALNALNVLGLSQDGYTVSYVKAFDENNVIALNGAEISAGNTAGEATVVATVTNARNVVVGTVTYNVTVAEVAVENHRSIYVPVNGSATLSGLSGDLYTGLFDESIAEYTVNDSGDVIFTGISVGQTVLVVGTTQVNVFVNPENIGSGANSSKSISINIDRIANCTVYYSINGGPLCEIDATGMSTEDPYVLIDQTYTDGFNIMFFAVPEEGYALTKMAATNSDDQYYSLSTGELADGSDSAAWPFVSSTASTVPSSGGDSAWVSGHGYRWCLIEGNLTVDGMRDLFTRALQLGADGTNTFTKNGSDGLATNLSFTAEKLPTFSKDILNVNGEPYADGTPLEFGDVITYRFEITSYSENVSYTDIVLEDDLIGYTKVLSDGLLNTAGTYTYTATYTVKDSDMDMYTNGVFENNATLSYTYMSNYSSGKYDYSDRASVSCKIGGIVYYGWMDGLPAGITDDITNYPLPFAETVTYGTTVTVKPYIGKTEYVVTSNGVETGSWSFVGWQYDGIPYTPESTLTMPYNDSIGFVGMWEYTPAETYRVTYSWTNAPEGTVLPADGTDYYEGQVYVVDSSYVSGTRIDDGTLIWTFSGWKLDGGIVDGEQLIGNTDVVLLGTWTTESKLTSLTIRKDGYSDHKSIDPDQTFLFRITGNSVDLTVTVHGDEAITVTGLMAGGTYTVTELCEWAWRYELDNWSFTTDGNTDDSGTETKAVIELGASGNEILFTNKRACEYWLDGDTYELNIFDDNQA